VPAAANMLVVRQRKEEPACAAECLIYAGLSGVGWSCIASVRR
jgi:hypothetical protein